MRTAYSVEPTLPFVLLDRPAPEEEGSVAVIARLDQLHGLMETTRSELHALRALNARLLELMQEKPRAAEPEPSAVAGAAAGSPELTIRVLGSFEARAGELAIESWRSRKARQLFAYLALEPQRPVARETLIETFWPESAPARGANNLSIAVHHIRSRLATILATDDGSRGVSVQQGLYRLDPELRWRVDAVEFRRQIDAAKAALGAGRPEQARTRLEAALAEYGGDLLESDLTEEWTLEPRQALASLYQWAAGWLVAHAAEGRDWQQVLQLAQQLVRRDPGDEAGHRWLIRAHAALGNRGRALRQYRACEEWLREELDVPPSEETQALLRELRL